MTDPVTTDLAFREVFGFFPEVTAEAPGRVNVLGDHTDYNDGFVLPLGIPQTTRVAIGRSPDGYNRFYSAQCHSEGIIRYLPGMRGLTGFSVYIDGCLHILRAAGFPLPALSVYVDSTVPIGVGLSSSAALEVAVLRGFRALFELPLDDVSIAMHAQQAEVRYVHMHCGIMDQMAASLADPQHMLFLDTRTLARKRLPLPQGTSILALDSGISRRLTESGYNQRRSECATAARQLHVTALRDIANIAQTTTLPPPLDRRARHVVSENQRVLTAARTLDPIAFGQLMNASHASLRDDFEVSIPELDRLVALLQEQRDVFGARLTGAGFGGACVALVRAGNEDAITTSVLTGYEAQGQHGRRLV